MKQMHSLILDKRQRLVATLILARAGRGNEEDLAFADEVGVADGGVGLGDAEPGVGMVELGLRDGPERVAMTHGVLGGGAHRRHKSGKNNLGAGLDVIGIAEAGIDGSDFLPAAPIAKALGSEFPKRVARFHDDDIHFGGDGRSDRRW